MVGSELVKGRAIVLPTVHDSFCEFARAGADLGGGGALYMLDSVCQTPL